MANNKAVEKEGPVIIDEASGEAAVITGKTEGESGILIKTDRQGGFIDAIDLGPISKPVARTETPEGDEQPADQ